MYFLTEIIKHMARLANRKDSNHKQIVDELRRNGWYVTDVSNIPKICDIRISAKWNRTPIDICVEIKDGSKAPSKRKLTSDEKEYIRAYPSHVAIVENVDDVAVITQMSVDFCFNKGNYLDIMRPMRYKVDLVLERG